MSRADVTRAVIMEAALECFSTNGYAATSVHDIVEAAHVTKGALYHHFPSKEALLLQISHEAVDFYVDLVTRTRLEHDSPSEAMVRLVVELLAAVEPFKRHVHIFAQERRYLFTPPFAEVLEKRSAFEREVTAIIEEGQRRGEFRPLLSARLMAFGIVGIASWATQWHRPGGHSAEEIGEMYARVLLEGLRPRGPE